MAAFSFLSSYTLRTQRKCNFVKVIVLVVSWYKEILDCIYVK